MCGILAKLKSSNEIKFLESLSMMRHRGPDNIQVRSISEHKLDLGHCRLSILDVSDKGNQPMRFKDHIILFNGEIYNFKELKKKYNIKIDSNTDTEVALKLYVLKGKNFIKELDGEFAIVITDLIKKKIYFARDPLGIKPLYFHLKNDDLIISSEIRSILNFIPSEINEKEFQKFLLNGFSSKNHTLFRGVKKVAPGEICEFDLKDNSFNREQYFELNARPKGVQKPTEYKRMLKTAIENAVKKRMISDVPISATLSGGIDSSIIVGIMAQNSKKVKTYSISIGNQKEDLKKARLIAKHFGTDHHEMEISFEQVFEDLEKIIFYAEEPMDKGSLIPTYYLAHAVKEKVTLIGEGADECFAGYKRHQLENNRHIRTFEEYYNRFIRLFPNKHNEKFSEFDPLNPNTILLYDLKNEIPEFHNMRIDKMFMSNSVEARVPYLDPEVVNLALRIPYILKQGPEKRILREAFEDLLPYEIRWRKKSALKIPYEDWVERDKIRETVLSSNIIPRKRIEYLYANPQERNRSRMLWYLYLTSQWKKIWL